MFRVFNVKSLSRITIYLHDFRPLNCCGGKKIFPTIGKAEKYDLYSTLPRHKVFIDPSDSRKTSRIKLRANPYEELLKILKVRELFLENNKFSSKKAENDQIEISPGDSKSTVGVPCTGEGIFTVKPLVKNKKKSPSKNQQTGIEKQKKTEPSKSGKKKAKLSEKKEDLKRTTKHSYAMHALKSYIEVCVNAGEVQRAQEYVKLKLEYFKRKYKIEKFNDLDLYNTLISGFARKGQLDKVKLVFSLMNSNDVVPNIQSYAGYLECISRSKCLNVTVIQKTVDDMKARGLSHRDILQKCVFKGDQKERIIEVLGFIDSDLPSPTSDRADAYSCKLLRKLNDKAYGKGYMHPNICIKEDDIPKLSAAQLEIESCYSLRLDSVDAKAQPNSKMTKSRKYLEECEDLWRKQLTAAFKNFINNEKIYHERGFHREESIYPYISVIDVEIVVNLLLQEVKLLAETGEFFSPSEKVMYKGLGVKIMHHYFVWLNKKDGITDKVLFIYQKYLSYLLDSKLLSEYSPREYWEHLKKVHSSGPTIDLPHGSWPHIVLIKIGCELYNILQRHISFNANSIRHQSPSKVTSQAFYITYEEGNDMKISRQIRTHHLLCKLYRDAKLDYLEFDTTLVPMLSPPRPWVKHNSGGLLITRTPFIRLNDHAIHQAAVYSKVPSQELNPFFDSLNSLSVCPWIINKPVLDIVIDVFQSGGNEELGIPLNPNSFPDAPKMCPSMSEKEKAVSWKQKKELKKKKCETSSLWYDCLYKLSIANHFRDKVFWFPHNLDFRGRVYPTPPHFNHLGSDMARSILLFAEGQPLGQNGLDWLKVQLINLTGFKKRDPHHERLRFANEMIPEILDSADLPFEGNQWWRKSDKPWQTLACCRELANALRHPKPEEYISHFPIHQDGSCNGLQHYAALGRDELGAKEVNLHPANSPQDVYSGVSALVERERQKDAAKDIEVAKALEGFVTRKVVKQTVMTFVYGVTKYGAKLQILKQLKDMPDFPKKYHHEGATYLMNKIFLSIKEMFTATQEIQDWFTDCAEQITRVSGDTLEWVTPLGLPVIQPYHKEIIMQAPKCSLPQGNESCLKYTSYHEPYQLPNIRKQKNGFAPNFIHSLDASHMMLTSLYLQRKGITFVSVHDCYWTHASAVEIMNKVCREQFVSLHKEPILEELSTFFLDKYARVVDEAVQGNKLKEKSARLKLRDILSTVPKKGTFDLDKVLESEYFFS